MHVFVKIKWFHCFTRVAFIKQKDKHDGVYFQHYRVCSGGCNLVKFELCLGIGMAQRKKKKNPILVEFAAKIRKRRHVLSLTQEELAERAGLHVNYIGGMERAERNPSLTTLFALAAALECSIEDLLSI